MGTPQSVGTRDAPEDHGTRPHAAYTLLGAAEGRAARSKIHEQNMLEEKCHVGLGGHVVGAGWLLLAGAAAAEPTAAGGDGKAGVGGRAVEGLAGYFKGWLPPWVRWGATAGAGTEWRTGPPL